ncbi:MAG: selenocysteine-specific translation elongation factor [Acidimicrobiia bacterium]|nr:selenocysteine-specific translation elongation factor [Acidimicrobiia bacterium]
MSEAPPARAVATAGHVDHGKSSLVRALTGQDPDRFAEERRRGLTIDLGFAHTVLPSGREVGFVDVPGHVRFIGNMLAGVGAVDVAVLVVAATDGWMPQSEEHLRILGLVGARHGMVAVTKAGLVDTDTLELALLEVEERLAGTALEGAPVVTCDSRSGEGIADVRTTLDAVLASAPPPRADGRVRLWADRVFAAPGAGTIVTGTLTGGALAAGDVVAVEPAGLTGRVRGVETHRRRRDRGWPGSRVAVNLAGVDHRALRRGHALVTPGAWLLTSTVDVRLTGVDVDALPRRGTVHLHVGSGSHRVRLRVLPHDADLAAPAFARIHLPVPLPLAPGDRMVVRDAGRQVTLGGAEVLDVAPTARAAEAARNLGRSPGERLLASHGWIAAEELERLGGRARPDMEALLAGAGAVRVGTHFVDPDVVDRLLDSARAAVAEHRRAHPHEPGLPLPELATAHGITVEAMRTALARASDLTVAGGVVAPASPRASASETPAGRDLLAALEASPFNPPDPDDIGLAKALAREGVAVEVGGTFFSAGAVDTARSLVRHALRERGSLTVAEARDLFGTTRKYTLPLLARLDAEGVTRRHGDERRAGPAAGT